MFIFVTIGKNKAMKLFKNTVLKYHIYYYKKANAPKAIVAVGAFAWSIAQKNPPVLPGEIKRFSKNKNGEL